MAIAETNSVAAKPMARRAWWTHRFVWLAALLLFALAIDAVLVEPYRVETTHYTVNGAVGRPLKIAQLSDFHTHGLGRREHKVLAILAAEKPDAIVITGDSLAGYGGTYQEVKQVYEQLHAPLGVWFVRGNWENDHPIRPRRNEKPFYESAGIHLLVNASAQLLPGIWLVGLDDPSSSPVHLDAALAGIPPDAYKIALFHAPGYFDHIAGHVNLALAGHTHGGQVRIPLVRPFWLPKDSGRFLAGWYDEAGSRMYVSRGIGMSFLPIRFLCRPEVAIITIQPEAAAS